MLNFWYMILNACQCYSYNDIFSDSVAGLHFEVLNLVVFAIVCNS